MPRPAFLSRPEAVIGALELGELSVVIRPKLDILANRLVKAAAEMLGRMRLEDQRSRDGLRWLGATLANVTPVRFSPHEVPEVSFDRLNEHYREVVALSRLILRHRPWNWAVARRWRRAS